MANKLEKTIPLISNVSENKGNTQKDPGGLLSRILIVIASCLLIISYFFGLDISDIAKNIYSYLSNVNIDWGTFGICSTLSFVLGGSLILLYRSFKAQHEQESLTSIDPSVTSKSQNPVPPLTKSAKVSQNFLPLELLKAPPSPSAPPLSPIASPPPSPSAPPLSPIASPPPSPSAPPQTPVALETDSSSFPSTPPPQYESIPSLSVSLTCQEVSHDPPPPYSPAIGKPSDMDRRPSYADVTGVFVDGHVFATNHVELNRILKEGHYCVVMDNSSNPYFLYKKDGLLKIQSAVKKSSFEGTLFKPPIANGKIVDDQSTCSRLTPLLYDTSR